MSIYLPDERQWKGLVDYILQEKEPIGWDTEFDGVDFDAGDNCVGRAVLDVWSIALFDGGFHPRGYSTSKGYVLPREAIGFFRPVLENPEIVKAAHNATVDAHTAYNAGVDVLNLVDTLSMYRWLYPGRMFYGLDVLGREFLDIGKFLSFKEIFTIPTFNDKEVLVKSCVCGDEDCRKRKLPEHQKLITPQTIQVESRKRESVKVSSIGPGDPGWENKVEYAGQDSVVGLGLFDYGCRKMKALNYENPFRKVQ